jgi:hypothetical protein
MCNDFLNEKESGYIFKMVYWDNFIKLKYFYARDITLF